MWKRLMLWLWGIEYRQSKPDETEDLSDWDDLGPYGTGRPDAFKKSK